MCVGVQPRKPRHAQHSHLLRGRREDTPVRGAGYEPSSALGGSVESQDILIASPAMVRAAGVLGTQQRR